MIQPNYGPAPGYNYNHITPAYGISSAVVSGLNLSLNTINGIQIGQGARGKTVPVIGLLTGAGQIVLGAAMFPEEQVSVLSGANYTNESQKTLSMVNIGVGTTTMILSIWNLMTNRTPKNKRTSWSIGPYSTPGNYTGLALSLTRKF